MVPAGVNEGMDYYEISEVVKISLDGEKAAVVKLLYMPDLYKMGNVLFSVRYW